MEDAEVVRLRRAVSKLARRLNGPATEAGVSPAEASVLALVATRHSIALTEVAGLEHVDPAILADAVDRLDAAGFLTRDGDQLDITDAGRATESRIRQHRADLVAAGATGLSPDDQARLAAAVEPLERLATAVT